MKIIIVVMKIILVSVFLLSGIGKLLSSYNAEKVFILILDLNIVPNYFTRYSIYSVALIELIVACGFIIKPKLIWPYTSLIIFVFFTLMLLTLPLRGILVPHCGCFGSIIPDGNLFSAVAKNIFFIALNIFYVYELRKMKKGELINLVK